MICLICSKEILDIDLKFMVAGDNPYFNVYIHRDCKSQLPSINIKDFIEKAVEEFNSKRKK